MKTLTPDQLTELKKEFIEFKINEMSYDDMASYIRDIWMIYSMTTNFVQSQRKVIHSLTSITQEVSTNEKHT